MCALLNSIPICHYIKLHLSMQNSALLQEFTQYVHARVLGQTDSLGYAHCELGGSKRHSCTSHAQAHT